MAYNLSAKGASYIEDLTVKVLTFAAGVAGTITNAMISASAAIATSKLINRVLAEYRVPDGTTVAVTSGDGVPIYTCNKTEGATLKAVTVVCPDAPSGGDLAFQVDIYKADVAAAAATVLSGTISYSSTQSDYEQEVGTISNATIDDGDTYLARVTVSGSSGIQGQGLLVQVEIEEAGS